MRIAADGVNKKVGASELGVAILRAATAVVKKSVPMFEVWLGFFFSQGQIQVSPRLLLA